MDLTTIKLPDTWEIKPIAQAYQFTKKPRGLNLHEFKSIPFFPMDSIKIGRKEPSKPIFKAPDSIGGGTYFENGNLLLAKITPSFENGKQAIIRNDYSFGYGTTEVIPIKSVTGKGDIDYLYFLLLHPELRNELAGQMEGSTGRQRLSKEILGRRLIPLPPIGEQRRIAAILSIVQRAIELQERLITLTTELKKALMHKLFTEGIRGEPQKETVIGPLPESWTINIIGEIATLKSGGTPSRKKGEYWQDGSIPWVKTGEVDYCWIVNTSEKITAEGLNNSSAKVFPPGTLIMAMYGQGITRGKVAILGIEAATNQACIAFFPNKNVQTLFLYYMFEYKYDELRRLGHGANQKNLSADILKTFKIPFPKDVSEQNEITEVISTVDKKIKSTLKKKKVYSDLFRTLLHQLMTAQIRVNDIDLSELELEVETASSAGGQLGD